MVMVGCLMIARLARVVTFLWGPFLYSYGTLCVCRLLLNSVYLTQSADYCWLCFPLFCWKEMHMFAFQNKLVKCSRPIHTCIALCLCRLPSVFVWGSPALFIAQGIQSALQILCNDTMTLKYKNTPALSNLSDYNQRSRQMQIHFQSLYVRLY